MFSFVLRFFVVASSYCFVLLINILRERSEVCQLDRGSVADTGECKCRLANKKYIDESRRTLNTTTCRARRGRGSTSNPQVKFQYYKLKLENCTTLFLNPAKVVECVKIIMCVALNFNN